MKIRHVALLLVCMAAAFGASYGTTAKAWPTPYHTGYFTGAFDTAGVDVFPSDSDSPGCSASGGYAVPFSIDTPGEFINFIKCKLNSPNNYGPYVNLERTGAAFIIQTMLGATANNRPPNATQIADWEARVNYYASQGWINWNVNYSYSYNTFYMGTYNSSSPNDDGFYGNNGSAPSIVFSNGSSSYGIRRQCSNPVGTTFGGLQASWAGQGRSTVTNGITTGTDIDVTPGQSLTFNHYIQNLGPGNAGIWYATYGLDEPANPWTAQYYNNTTLSGAPVLTRQVNRVSYIDNTGNTPIAPGVITDGFSARFTRTQNFAAGDYLMTLKVDDGGRLYVDGNLIIDKWISQGATPYSVTRTLSAGNHTIVVEYFEGGGPGWVSLDYTTYTVQFGTNSGSYTPGQEKLVNTQGSITVPNNAPVGTQYCRRILWDWRNSAGTGESGLGTSGMGASACATVISTYDLLPTVVPSQTAAQEGDTVTFDYRIENAGSVSPGAQCYVRDGNGVLVGAPLSCSVSQSFNGYTAPTSVGTENVSLTGLVAGSTVCRRLYIQPATPSVANRASTLSCVVVAKAPLVRFGGNDVWAGGGFPAVTPACNISAKITTVGRPLSGTAPVEYAGSSTEYNAFALNRIFAFGSAGRALVGSGALGDLSRSMTFANNEAAPALIGHYGAAQHCLEDYSSLYESLPVGGALPITSGTSGAWHSASFPSLSGTAPAGVTKVYYSDGDVTITGDIAYPGSYNNVGQIPSILVVAKGNIYVAPTVTRMDGVYVTRGTFYTCYPKVEPSVVGNCANPLTVNGAVVANRLDLFRTGGADGPTTAGRKTPAELFNFSPEVYLRNAVQQTSEPTIQVLNSIELPPRF